MSAMPIFHKLNDLPVGAQPLSVEAVPVDLDGDRVLKVSLSESVTATGVPDVDYIDEPTFLLIPAGFSTGTIEVDLRADLAEDAPDYARGFAGIAYHITNKGDRFEAIYLRPLNGTTLNPPPPRHLRAVQYFAYPDWKYSRLRSAYPEGVYEAGADIRPGRWIHLKLVIKDTITISIDNATVLTVDTPKVAPTQGSVGLFVDIGTTAYFANLSITE